MTSARAICGIREIFRYKSPPVPVLVQPVRFCSTMMQLRASAGRPGVPGARVPAPPGPPPAPPSRFGDGTHITEMKEGFQRQPCGYTKTQVAATCLDPRNMPSLKGIPMDEHDKAWNIVTEMLVAKIKALDPAPTRIVTDAGSSGIENMEAEWMECAAHSEQKSAKERAELEVEKWKTRKFQSDPKADPLQVWKKMKANNVCPYLVQVARDVLAVPATSAAPERKFSVAGDMNRQKRGRLTCDNMEELVYLNQALPVLKKMRVEKEVKGVSMEGSSTD